MRRLIESVLVSLDVVIGSPGQWASFDAEDTALSLEALGDCEALVMGRVTYPKVLCGLGPRRAQPVH
jgi:hypothetical protein